MRRCFVKVCGGRSGAPALGNSGGPEPAIPEDSGWYLSEAIAPAGTWDLRVLDNEVDSETTVPEYHCPRGCARLLR